MSWAVKANLFAAVVSVGVVVGDCIFGPPNGWTAVNLVCAVVNTTVAVVLWERR